MTKSKSSLEKLQTKLAEANALAQEAKRDEPGLESVFSFQYDQDGLNFMEFKIYRKGVPNIQGTLHGQPGEIINVDSHGRPTDPENSFASGGTPDDLSELKDVPDIDSSDGALHVTHPDYDTDIGEAGINSKQPDAADVAPGAHRRGLTETER